MSFTPELGQFAFTNTPWQEVQSPDWMEPGLELIADAIKVQRGEPADSWSELTSNGGGDPYESEVFAMRSYCWCDGLAEGHEDGCPPNFEHKSSGLVVNWYKHSRRGRSQNIEIDQAQWLRIVADCLADAQARP